MRWFGGGSGGLGGGGVEDGGRSRLYSAPAAMSALDAPRAGAVKRDWPDLAAMRLFIWRAARQPGSISGDPPYQRCDWPPEELRIALKPA